MRGECKGFPAFHFPSQLVPSANTRNFGGTRTPTVGICLFAAHSRNKEVVEALESKLELIAEKGRHKLGIDRADG